MKKTKRFLSLALVLVMMFSLVQLATALKFDEYSDGDDVKYKEEVAVLTGIGVIGGDDRNNDGVMDFRPTDFVTREEAAKIIAYLLLTPAVAEALPASATGFPDVAITDWSAKFVAYCSSQGIIKGRSDGKFYPQQNVTGAELAIMLMRALGVGNPERYTGVNWEMNAIVDGMDLKLLNTGVDYTKAATREETVKYAFQALFHSPSGKGIEKIYAIKSIDPVTGIVEYGWVDTEVVAADSLAGKRYPTLDNNEFGQAEAIDALGRPSKTWTYNKEIIYVMSTDPVRVFNKTVTQDDLYRVIGAGATSAFNFQSVVVNDASGQRTATLTSLRNSGTAPSPSASAAVYGSNNGGNGIITEIYKVGIKGDASDYRAVIIVPTFAAVTVKATAATANRGAYDTYSFGTGTNPPSGIVYSTNVDAANEKDTAVISGNVADKDSVLYYFGNDANLGKILYIEAVDSITGVIASITSAGNITIDGTITQKASAYLSSAAQLSVSPTGVEGEYYVDSFNYILGIKTVTETAVKVAMIVAADSYAVLEDGKVITKYSASIVDMDGAMYDVTAAAYYGKVVSPPSDGYIGLVCSYEINNKGQYVFTPISERLPAISYTYGTVETLSNYKVITDVVTPVKGTSGLGGTHIDTASNSTKFYMVNQLKDESVTVSVVTGFSNIPTGLTGAASFGVSYSAVASTNPNSVANVVYIWNAYAIQSAKYVFYLDTFEELAAGTTINVHVNGATGNTLTGLMSGQRSKFNKYALYENVYVSDNGTVSGTTTFSPVADPINAILRGTTGLTSAEVINSGFAVSAKVSYDSGVLFKDGVTANIICDADIPVYTVTMTGATVITTALSSTVTLGPLVTSDAVDLDQTLGANDYVVVVLDDTITTVDIAVAIYVYVFK